MRMFLLAATVVTEGGKRLGRVRDVEVAWPDFRVTKLVVRQSIFGGELLIAASAIVRLEAGTVVVRETLIAEKAHDAEPSTVQEVETSPVLTRDTPGSSS